MINFGFPYRGHAYHSTVTPVLSPVSEYSALRWMLSLTTLVGSVDVGTLNRGFTSGTVMCRLPVIYAILA